MDFKFSYNMKKVSIFYLSVEIIMKEMAKRHATVLYYPCDQIISEEPANGHSKFNLL